MTVSVLRFSDSFWDEEDRGIDILTDKLTNSEQTCKDLKKIYEIRAQIEKDYGERLLELSQHTLGEIELGTLAKSMQRIPFAFETTARAHIDMAEQLNTTLEAPLTSFLKEQCELINARTHQMENSKHLKDMHQAHVDKAKQAYDELHQLLKQKQENGEDIETVQNSLALADQEWQHSVEILQEVTDKFTFDWKITCDLYQDLEERRINFVRSNLWAFANMMSSVYIVDDRGCESIRTGLETTDVRKDINDFILKYGTSVKIPTNQSQLDEDHSYSSPSSTGNQQSLPADSMSFAFQEVENMLSDSGSVKRHSLDHQSIHSASSSHQQRNSFSSNSTGSPHQTRAKNEHSTITPRDSFDSNHHQRQPSVTTIEPQVNTSPTKKPVILSSSPASSSSQQPDSSTTTATATSTSTVNNIKPESFSGMTNSPSGSSNSNNTSTILSNINDDDSDDDDIPRQPLRMPKPREEKWTISARRTGPSTTSTTRPNQRINNSSNNSNNSNNNNNNTGVKMKSGYLDPSIHPPPLQQQQQQQYYKPSSQSSLYPPENYAVAANNNTSSSFYNHASNNNSRSSFYQQASTSSTNSLTIDVAPSITSGQGTVFQAQNTTSSHTPSTDNNNMSTYQPNANTAITYQPPSASGPTIASTYQPSHISSTYQISSTATSTYQQPSTTTVAYKPATTVTAPGYLPVKNTNHPATATSSAITTQQQSQFTLDSYGQPPPANTKIGIRPPVWQDDRKGELEGTTASEYMQGEASPTSPLRPGLQRFKSVNGPRAPPPKDNYIAPSELKNTRGFGEETVSILKEGNINNHSDNKDDEDNKNEKDENDDKNKADETTKIPVDTTTTTTEASASQQQEEPKSGFSFNNIFFKKDKPATSDGSKLPDGTVYKHKARAMWSYEAKIDSELSFQANDTLAVIRKQPDGWWEAEILDDKRRQRGLVPGNYMSLN
ncbi:uncharacterized protein BX664DRAFT_328371 [Halteromyces radiatus]|uniref:uncharacterized protein n=1 Tax=Halteromyces radiatus TaxID=101107 RepID=UPI002220453D|nr:uncharacterized protein BX664DRAFT_328371 [Halteromyces radiatus]KAI8092877.1 hypothetical protein BX664DRAFT_328371 [Halteromyces radiatus]